MKWQVAVDGRAIEIDSEQLAGVRQVEAGVYSVLLDGASYEIRIHPPPPGSSQQEMTASVEGRQFCRRGPQSARCHPRLTHGSRIGTPERDRAHAGQSSPRAGGNWRIKWKASQGLVVVEAMKMQNELKAARPGTGD